MNRIGNSWKLRRSVDKTPLDPNLYSFGNENNKKSIYIQQITAQSTTFSVQHGNTCFKKKKDILIFFSQIFVSYYDQFVTLSNWAFFQFNTYKILCSIIFLLIYRFSECEITKVIQSEILKEKLIYFREL